MRDSEASRIRVNRLPGCGLLRDIGPNVAFGVWFIAAPWLPNGGTTAAAWNDVAVGIALSVLSLPRGPVGERYGSWQRFIR